MSALRPVTIFQLLLLLASVCFLSTCESGETIISATRPPACQAPAGVHFGDVLLGSKSERSFIMTNTGGGTLSGSITIATPCSTFAIISGGGDYSLASGQKDTVTVQFIARSVGLSRCWIDTGNDLCGEIELSGSVPVPEGGFINPYWDAFGTNCLLPPGTSDGLIYVYIFHEGIARASGATWVLESFGGFDPAYVSFSTGAYLNILSQPTAAAPLNSPLGGISVAYGNPACEPLPAMICSVIWFFTETQPLCSGVRIGADPIEGFNNINVRDCNNMSVPAAGGTAYVGTSDCGACPAPVTPQAWEQIKSIYE